MPPTPEPDNNAVNSRQQWHRLFGLMLQDQFYGSPYRVELSGHDQQDQCGF